MPRALSTDVGRVELHRYRRYPNSTATDNVCQALHRLRYWHSTSEPAQPAACTSLLLGSVFESTAATAVSGSFRPKEECHN